MRWPLLLLFVASGVAGCGGNEPSFSVAVSSSFALSDAQKAKCPLCSGSATACLPVDQLKAKLIVSGMEATPFALKVAADTGGQINVSGEATGIKPGQPRTLTLRWYVVGKASGNEVTLAESLGRADLTSPTAATLDVLFDPTQPSLKPKTKAGATEAAATKD